MASTLNGEQVQRAIGSMLGALTAASFAEVWRQDPSGRRSVPDGRSPLLPGEGDTEVVLPHWARWMLQVAWEADAASGPRTWAVRVPYSPRRGIAPIALLPFMLATLELDVDEQVERLVALAADAGAPPSEVVATGDLTLALRMLVDGEAIRTTTARLQARADLHPTAQARSQWHRRHPTADADRLSEPDQVALCFQLASGARNLPAAVHWLVAERRGSPANAPVLGACFGARVGVQGLPSSWTTYLNFGGWGSLDDVYAAAYRLLGRSPAPLAAPEPATEPVLVSDRAPLYASDWMGAARSPSDWGVVSLCRTGAEMQRHAYRRQIYLVDQEGSAANLNLTMALDEAIWAIHELMGPLQQRPVVVHCHAGVSRTAFVLKGWAMHHHGYDEAQAHEWLLRSWPRAARTNQSFTNHLRSRQPRRPAGPVDPQNDGFGAYLSGLPPWWDPAR